MEARLWTALLLAAVFSMHGLQCGAADSPWEHGSTSLGAAASVGVPVAAIQTVVSAGVPDHSHVGPMHGVRDAGASGSTSLPSPWQDAHVLVVCLAVLLVGLTIRGASARIRGMAIPFVRGPPGPCRWSTGLSRQPRPPDLSLLCLLRI